MPVTFEMFLWRKLIYLYNKGILIENIKISVKVSVEFPLFSSTGTSLSAMTTTLCDFGMHKD